MMPGPVTVSTNVEACAACPDASREVRISRSIVCSSADVIFSEHDEATTIMKRSASAAITGSSESEHRSLLLIRDPQTSGHLEAADSHVASVGRAGVIHDAQVEAQIAGEILAQIEGEIQQRRSAEILPRSRGSASCRSMRRSSSRPRARGRRGGRRRIRRRIASAGCRSRRRSAS